MQSFWSWDNAEEDGVVTLREFVVGVKELGYAETLDTDEFVSYWGQDYDWINDNGLIASVLTHGVDLESYLGVYALCEQIGFPWVTDDYFSGTYPLESITIDEFAVWVDDMKHDHDGSWTEPSENWIALDDRFDQTFMDHWQIIDFEWNAYHRP